MAHVSLRLLAGLLAAGLLGCGGKAEQRNAIPAGQAMTGAVRVGFLHHSTGGVIWGGGMQAFVQGWNAAHATDYRLAEVTYPATSGGYPWANYPYDYWNLWVAHAGTQRDRGEANLDDLVAAHDVIVWKHCFPVSAVGADTGSPSISSSSQTLENYKLQYQALKARMRQFPGKRFLVWTGAALVEGATSAAEAQRARDFFTWVKAVWDEPGDNIFVWDFQALETGGGLYLLPAYAASDADSHPNATLAALAAPLVGRRIVDIIEGRGDTGSLTGQ